jgi:hypothetical protein
MNVTSNLGKPRTGIFSSQPLYDYVIKCWLYNDSGRGEVSGYRYWTGSKFVKDRNDPDVLRFRSRIKVYKAFAQVIDNDLDKVVKVRRK